MTQDTIGHVLIRRVRRIVPRPGATADGSHPEQASYYRERVFCLLYVHERVLKPGLDSFRAGDVRVTDSLAERRGSSSPRNSTLARLSGPCKPVGSPPTRWPPGGEH